MNRHERRKQKAQLHDCKISLTAISDLSEKYRNYLHSELRAAKWQRRCIICEQEAHPHSLMLMQFCVANLDGDDAVGGMVCEACVSCSDLCEKFCSRIVKNVRLEPITKPRNTAH